MLGKELGESYESRDRAVVRTGHSVFNKLELHIYPNGTVGCCITNKHELFDNENRPVGIAGVSQDLRAPDTTDSNYERLSLAIDHVQNNLSEPPVIATLTKLAGLSPYQLDRRMRIMFGLTTGQWVLKQRLDRACQLLTLSRGSIVDVVLDTGYADQSAFTRRSIVRYLVHVRTLLEQTTARSTNPLLCASQSYNTASREPNNH